MEQSPKLVIVKFTPVQTEKTMKVLEALEDVLDQANDYGIIKDANVEAVYEEVETARLHR